MASIRSASFSDVICAGVARGLARICEVMIRAPDRSIWKKPRRRQLPLDNGAARPTFRSQGGLIPFASPLHLPTLTAFVPHRIPILDIGRNSFRQTICQSVL